MANTNVIKKWHWWLILGIVIVGLIMMAYSSYWPKVTLGILGRDYRVLLADTFDHRYSGWGGHTDMGRYDGMLFAYSSRARHTVVMRDMNFALDIIWLDVDRNRSCNDSKGLRSSLFKVTLPCQAVVVDIAPSVAVEPGKPENQLTVYAPRAYDLMVVEMPSGFMAQTGLKIGDKVQISR